MRNILLSAVLLAGTLMSGAQTAEPNRLLVVSESGSYQSFMTERVEAVEFRTVEGPVEAAINISGCTLTSVQTSITMSESCSSYLINCYPAVIARQLKSNPAGAFSYMAQTGAPQYSEDFSDGTLSGLELQPGTEYAIVTAAYDELGTECDVCLGTFTTPSEPVTGNPQVTFKQTGNTHFTITGEFTANSDVDGYSYLIGEKGELEAQFEQFAGMFGFSNIAEMVKMWGVYVAHNDSDEHTWKDLEPNKEYEIYVQAWDVKEVPAPVQIFEASTAKMGGSGAAYVNIKVGAYKLADWDGEMKPSLYVDFMPNDQAGAYRVYCAFADDYDKDPQEYKDYVCQEPEMSMANWFLYGNKSTDYQVDPGNSIVILAAAKNADGVWGEVNEVRHTTPANVSAGMPAAPGQKVAKRADRGVSDTAGKVPANAFRRVRMEK